jgi:hypothetical protein
MVQSTLFEINGVRSAVISADGLYRYRLVRSWSDGSKVHFLMLNPSKADGCHDDPTVRRCMGFAESWGYGGLIVTNLFAWRSTDPDALRSAPDPVGPENDQHILSAARECAMTVLAWGIPGKIQGRDKAVLKLLREANIPPYCIASTATGQPGHPLFLPSRLTPRPLV